MSFHFEDLGIKDSESQATSVLQKLIPSTNWITSQDPHVFMRNLWERFEELHINSRNLNGRVFEYALILCLASRGIIPIYTQIELLHVVGVEFDIAFFDNGIRPIVISAKTSLRERWKQAELEGRSLKQVYLGAECYLVTMTGHEAANVQRKVERFEAVGFDRVVLATDEAFSQLVEKLSNYNLKVAENFPTVTKGVRSA